MLATNQMRRTGWSAELADSGLTSSALLNEADMASPETGGVQGG